MVAGRDDARFLNLNMIERSDEAVDLVEAVANETWRLLGKGGNPGKKHKAGCAAFIGDLLKVYGSDAERYAYRTLGTSDFTGQRIGFRVFKNVVTGFERAGFIRLKKGTGGGKLIGQATRFRATPKLVGIAASFAVDVSDWRKHFRSLPRPKEIANPLVLKTASEAGMGKKRPGSPMPFVIGDPKAEEAMKQGQEINAYFADVAVDPDDAHYAFQRVFNEGNVAGFDWNRGGRLVSMGDSYQQMPADDRSKIKLNGEPVVELDIRASHLTILHAKLGRPFDPAGDDPYRHPKIPRNVLKAWVTMTLGYDRFQTRWSSDAVDDYREATGRKLGKDFPIKIVREEALRLVVRSRNAVD
jgi:hypothetical protein